jgi:hypothetical protein
LFTIPLELRLQIYELVLFPDEASRTQNADNGVTEPHILHTNKQIRREARPIFYKTTKLEVPLGTLDLLREVRLMRWSLRLRSQYGDGAAKVFSDGFITPHWANLVEYLRLIHARKLKLYRRLNPPCMQSSEISVEAMVLCGMFELALGLQKVPWETVKRQLEEQRCVLVKLNGRWKGDEDSQ